MESFSAREQGMQRYADVIPITVEIDSLSDQDTADFFLSQCRHPSVMKKSDELAKTIVESSYERNRSPQGTRPDAWHRRLIQLKEPGYALSVEEFTILVNADPVLAKMCELLSEKKELGDAAALERKALIELITIRTGICVNEAIADRADSKWDEIITRLFPPPKPSK